MFAVIVLYSLLLLLFLSLLTTCCCLAWPLSSPLLDNRRDTLRRNAMNVLLHEPKEEDDDDDDWYHPRSHQEQIFPNILPLGRLGKEHDTLGSFQTAVQSHKNDKTTEKHYSLIVVQEPCQQRLLVGLKHRGFGVGLYNSFGGKVEPGETPLDSACRELAEETGIVVTTHPLQTVGTLRFTFADSTTEMVVHLFCLTVQCNDTNNKKKTNQSNAADTTDSFLFDLDPTTISGCDEITPQWFTYRDLPLDRMFADDSLWLPRLLLSQHANTNTTCTLSNNPQSPPQQQPPRFELNGWFHFLPGGQTVNTIQHYHIQTAWLDRQNDTTQATTETTDTHTSTDKVRPTKPLRSWNLEQRLFHALHMRKLNSPTIKEFKEAYAFVRALRLKKAFDVVLDVAGGHGALGALFCITTSIQHAIIIDPAQVGNQGVQRAWGSFLNKDHKTLRYRHECLRTGLPKELQTALQTFDRSRILVVACHACQHLSDEIVQISCQYGVSVAVMPCCQSDTTNGKHWKQSSHNLGIPIQYTMDLLLAGKALSWNVGQELGVTYDVRVKVIDKSITPQNRLVLCRAISTKDNMAAQQQQTNIAKAHQSLQIAYARAHQLKGVMNKMDTKEDTTGRGWWQPSRMMGCRSLAWTPIVSGFVMGVVTGLTVAHKPWSKA